MNSNLEAEFQNYEDLKKSFVSGRLEKNNVKVDFENIKSVKPLMLPLKKVENIPIKYLTSEDMQKYNTITGAFGTDPSKMDDNTKLRNSSFRNSGRPYEQNYMSVGYKGQGAESGDISVSTKLRKEENVRTVKSKNNDLDSKDNNLSHLLVSSYSKLMNVYSNNLDNRGGIISRDDARMD